MMNFKESETPAEEVEEEYDYTNEEPLEEPREEYDPDDEELERCG